MIRTRRSIAVFFRLIVFSTTFLLVSTPFASADDKGGSEADTRGEGHLIFRYRFENVDQDGFSKDAVASILRTRLNYRTRPYGGISFFAELDDLTYVGDDDFNNTRNGRTNFPVVADPDGTDVNQMFFDYKTANTLFKLGRQRINLDNQRFVGGVGWRQNEQTYDSFRLTNSGKFDKDSSWNLDYMFVENVSRIFGPDKGTPPNKLDSQTHLANLRFKSTPLGSLTAYGYFMDLKDAPALSNRTIGVRYSSSLDAGSFKVPFIFEYATQDDYGDNPVSYSANYYFAQVGLKAKPGTFLVAYEVMEGASTAGKSFRTPLATLHAFQGWADKFLSTPAGGIEDFYVGLRHKRGKHSLTVTWHDFNSESGSVDYGTELDAAWGYKISKHYSVLLKAAFYDAQNFSTDTNKIWVMFSASF